MNIDIVRATTEDLAVIENLVPYYIYDMSEFMGWDCNSDGKWDGCCDIPDYWYKPDHHPFVIKVDQGLAGFAMIRRYPNEVQRYEIGEFFIVRKFKGRGVGRKSAFWFFNAFPGKWVVRVLDENAGARRFWEKVIREYTGGVVDQTEEQYTCPHSGTWPMQFYRFETVSQQGNALDRR